MLNRKAKIKPLDNTLIHSSGNILITKHLIILPQLQIPPSFYQASLDRIALAEIKLRNQQATPDTYHKAKAEI